MKSKKITIALATILIATAFSGSAFADDKWLGDQGTNWQDHIQSTKSRAEVIAELRQAQKDGTLRTGDSTFYPPEPAAASGSIRTGKTRAEVQNEAAQTSQHTQNALSNIYFGG